MAKFSNGSLLNNKIDNAQINMLHLQHLYYMLNIPLKKLIIGD